MKCYNVMNMARVRKKESDWKYFIEVATIVVLVAIFIGIGGTIGIIFALNKQLEKEINLDELDYSHTSRWYFPTKIYSGGKKINAGELYTAVDIIRMLNRIEYRNSFSENVEKGEYTITVGGLKLFARSSNATVLIAFSEGRISGMTDAATGDSIDYVMLEPELIAEFSEEKRDIAELRSIPNNLKLAVIATEDRKFYSHKGVYWPRMIKSLLVNVLSGRKKQGASTITQQLARNLFLTPEKTISRKIKEALLAMQIEKKFTKDEILERYLNKICFGHGAYGVESAAKRYFKKHVEDLNLAECALLAGLPAAPEYFSPLKDRERAKKRHRIVLNSMIQVKYVTYEQANSAYKFFWNTFGKESMDYLSNVEYKVHKAPYFVEYIRQKLSDAYGADALYRRGLKVYTTIDVDLQSSAERTLYAGLQKLNDTLQKRRRQNPKADLAPYIEGALVAINPQNGGILAMVGGSGWHSGNQLNRTVQARRQPGSAFKPFVYAVAIENGYTNANILLDAPVKYHTGGKTWTPRNYGDEYHGNVTLRKALTKSLNTATIRLIERLTPNMVINYAKRMGISSKLTSDLSLGLGTSEVTPLEITASYGVFINNGVFVEPSAIKAVYDNNNNLLEESSLIEHDAISVQTAYLVTSLLTGVVKFGTAAYSVGSKIGRICAGKTGTTNEYSDAWFIGFTPDIVAGVWVGYDGGRKTIGYGSSGGAVAAPIWTAFIKDGLSYAPDRDFPVPENVVFVKIDAVTGLKASAQCRNVIDECFKRGMEPKRICDRCAKGEIKEEPVYDGIDNEAGEIRLSPSASLDEKLGLE